MQDAGGLPLDRWHMCTKLEEPVILQQFLAFRETRTITQQLIIQDLAERSQSFNPFLDKERGEKRLGQESLLQLAAVKDERAAPPSPRREQPAVSPPVSPPKQVTPPANHASPSQQPAPIFPRAGSTGIPLPPTSMAAAGLISNHFPMFPFPGLPATLAQSACKEVGGKEQQVQFNSALNLSRGERQQESGELDSEAGSRRSSLDTESHRKEPRLTLPEDIGITYVSPTTGKKRVQCNVCMKTFCDKGALKIHFSAVHLREMHRCTVHGCTMMFSSRRSRNRHSANPNPKLHTPQVKRRISQHDGRTHQGSLSPAQPILPKENIDLPKENSFPVPGFPGAGQGHAPALPPGIAFPGLPGFNPFMPPDLKALQQDLQRFSDLQKLYGARQSGGEAGEQRASSSKSDSDTETHKHSDSTSDSSNRKRKSQNPTKRPHLEMEDNDHISSDSASDEGFPDPMMEDDDDDLDNVSSGDEAA